MHKVWSSKNLENMLEANDRMRLQEQVCNRAADLSPQPTELKSRLLPLDNIRGIFFDIYGTLLISEVGEIISGQISDEDLKKEQGEKDREGVTNRAKMDLDEEALEALPKLLRASLPQDFQPSKLLEQAILAEHQSRKTAELQYPEVDIVSLWHRIFLEQLDEDMQRSFSPFMLARFILEYELLHNKIQLMPGALELLHWLAVRNFYVGIISNAQFYTPIILCALLGVNDLADLNIQKDLCFWSYHYGYSKPQKEFFVTAQKALAHHDLESKEVLYLGNDMRNDVWGSAQVGFVTALFAGDQRSLRLRKEIPKVAKIKPYVITTDLGQLKGIL